MDSRLLTKLRIEKSENDSGTFYNLKSIPVLKESNYYVRDFELDGDAPKQFIKAYIGPSARVHKRNLDTWSSYIAKTAEKWYPHESVIEFMINRIGQSLGLKMNDIELFRINNQIRFLSKYFRNSNEILIHGAEICGDFLNDREMAKQIADSKKSARELFTFEFICKAIQQVFPSSHETIILDLIRMVTFDGLVGNNDRHFYNWGVLDTLKKSKKPPKFAPLYDSARGLLWNWDNERIVNSFKHYKAAGRAISRYIDEAAPRISIEGDSQVNHFELIRFIKGLNEHYAEVVNSLATVSNENRVLAMLEREFWPFFSYERCFLTAEILKIRFERIRSL